jgi:internalin A
MINFDTDGCNPFVGELDLSDFTALKYVELRGNDISSLNLFGCVSLESLSYRMGTFVDFTQLAQLTNLQYLSLGENQITDITPLSGLTNLRELYLGDNLISDITPLSGLTKLKGLYLSPNPEICLDLYRRIAETVIIKNDGHLSAGILSQCEINAFFRQKHGDFTPCRNRNTPCGCCVLCKNCVECLHLCFGKDCDIDPCINCAGIVVRNLDNRGITSEMFAEMAADGTIPKNVTSLSLRYNKINDLTPLAQFKDLRYLDLTGYWFISSNQISDLTPLAGLTNLTNLYLGGNEISDLTPLAGLKNLNSLILGDNLISDITPLSGLNNLTRLQLWGDKHEITDISPLSGLTRLRDLSLTYNESLCLLQLGALGRTLKPRDGNTVIDACNRCNLCKSSPMPPFTPAIADSNPTIEDALEILKYLAGIQNTINNGTASPTIEDALEVLKYLAGIDSVFVRIL